MAISIEYDIRRTSVCLSVAGLHRRLIFNNMNKRQALRLLPQYGYQPEQVYDIRHEVQTLRKQLSDTLLHELIDQYGDNRLSIVTAIRHAYPHATRIIVERV